MIEPVTLYASTTILSGGSATLSAERMTPPGNRPMLVRDILLTLNILGDVNNEELNLGAVVRGRFRVGRYDMSNSHVPLWLYGNVPNTLIESVDNEFQGLMKVDDAAGLRQLARYRWVLPKPMYVGPGWTIQTSFSRDDSVTGIVAPLTTAAITIQMSVRGILLHQKAATTHIPYVGAFVPVTGQLQSRGDDLKNTLDKAIEIHRLTGRLVESGPGLIRDLLSGQDVLGADLVTATLFRRNIRIRDDNLLDITGGFVPMCSVFPAQGRSWIFKKALQSGHQLIVTTDAVPTTTSWPMVSFVGSRVEPVEG